MNGSIILDTNIVIGLFGNGKNIVANLIKFSNIFIPSIVIGELFYGAYNSGNKRNNIIKIQNFSNASTILTCDGITARYYGKIKYDLKKRGKPIPENDIWISALSVQHKIPIISRDSHFKNVSQIELIIW